MTNPFRAVPIRISLDEQTAQASRVPTKVQLLKTGTYYSDKYGKFDITPTMLASMKKNFDEKVRGIDLAIDYSHENQDVAAGWIKELELADGGKELWATVDWTAPAQEKLAHKQFRYLSAEFINNYKDNETLKDFGPTLFGAGLTNRPVIKNMAPVVELHETANTTNKEDELMNEEMKALQEQVKTLADAVAKLAAPVPPAPTDDAVDAELAKMSPEDMIKMIKDLKAQVAEMCAEKDKMAAAQKCAEREAKFAKLLSEGKAIPAQKDAFMSNDAEKFAELAQKLHETPAGHGGSGKNTDVRELSEEEKKVCKALGLTEEEFKKYN